MEAKEKIVKLYDILVKEKPMKTWMQKDWELEDQASEILVDEIIRWKPDKKVHETRYYNRDTILFIKRFYKGVYNRKKQGGPMVWGFKRVKKLLNFHREQQGKEPLCDKAAYNHLHRMEEKGLIKRFKLDSDRKDGRKSREMRIATFTDDMEELKEEILKIEEIIKNSSNNRGI